MTKALLLIDIQNDFIDAPDFQGALAVTGAYQDTINTANYIKNNLNNIDAIFKTVDTHAVLDIAHSSWWINKEGNEPTPFTLITVKDVQNGTWMAKDKSQQDYSLKYVKELASQNKYLLCIWPNHCIKDSKGWEISPLIKEALFQWENKTGKTVNYIYKGTNPKTEHYSGLKAEVVLAEDPTTELNTKVISALDSYDNITVAGQALSHCVASTVTDLINNIDNPSKVTVLEDCCSNVTGFEEKGNEFLTSLIQKGATVDQSTPIIRQLFKK